MLTSLSKAVIDLLTSGGFSVIAYPIDVSVNDKLEKIIVAPDTITSIEFIGVSPERKLIRDERRVTLLVYAKTLDDLDVKVSDIINTLRYLETKSHYNVTISVEPFYERESRLYGAEIHINGRSQYSVNW